MDELEIRTHDFEMAKKELKDFSEQATTDLDLKRVNESKGVGEWFSSWLKGGGFSTKHVVTGAELNELTSQIQKYLIDINNMHRKFIQEFGQVYNALEALDKDYIQSILFSIKASEETSKRIKAAHERIEKIMEDQKKTLTILCDFKKKLDDYAHLEDIDEMWSVYEKQSNDIKKLSNYIYSVKSISNENIKKINKLTVNVKTIDNKIVTLEKHLEQQSDQLESVILYTSELEKILHLHDIDEMWDSLSDNHNLLIKACDDLTSIKEMIDKQHCNIDILLSYMDTLSSYKHLKDIDEIWLKIESHSHRLDSLDQKIEDFVELLNIIQIRFEDLSKYREQLNNIIHLNDVDKLWNSNEIHSEKLLELEKQNEKIKSLIYENKTIIKSEVERNEASINILSKKIKYAYFIAFGSLGLAIAELIAILMKVI